MQRNLEIEARAGLKEAKRIVIKVGTSTVTYPGGAVDLENVERICRALANQMNQGVEVILVSSGAIAMGMNKMRENSRPGSLPEKQALAAIGQVALMNYYTRILAEYDHVAAQILLTKDDVDQDESRTNIINTFEALLEKKVLPIINENDSVSTREVLHNGTFGDNDTLSAIVAKICHADLLILLSDVDGLYDLDPHASKTDLVEAKMISFVPSITSEIEALGGDAGSMLGTGGMLTKIQAAKLANKAGIDMVITQGHRPEDISRILNGEQIGTLFAAK